MVTQFYLDEIESITFVGKKKTIDITVSGDNLFVANDILTHNSGASSSDAEMTDIGGSFGIPATADFIMSLARTEELDAIQQLLAKILKNRYRGSVDKKRFCLGVDIMTQTLYDVSESEQDGLVDTRPKEPEGKNLKEKFSTANKNRFAALDESFSPEYEVVPFNGFSDD